MKKRECSGRGQQVRVRALDSHMADHGSNPRPGGLLSYVLSLPLSLSAECTSPIGN